MTLQPEVSFGLSEVLVAARTAVEENEGILRHYNEAGVPQAEQPLFFDSKRIAVLAYKGAMERVEQRFWTTTFLASGFWSQEDSEILDANLRMLEKQRTKGATLRRLFLLSISTGEEIQRIQDERMLLLKCRDLDGLARFDQRIANLTKNIERLVRAGCDVRVVHDTERLSDDLPSELQVDPLDTEIAIYDDWRFDLFQGGLSGTIESVRGYTPVMRRFEKHRDAVIDFFERLWERSASITSFVDRLHRMIDYSSSRIDYDVSWLARYDLALTREDEALKMEEMSGVRVDLVRMERWGRIRRFLDVGTCTGRYPITLRDAVRPEGLIMGVDNDIDSVRFTQAKVARICPNDARFRIARHDFCAPEMLDEGEFELITCMMGTICHFERRSEPKSHWDDPFQRALEKFLDLLTRGGMLFFSVWTEQACRDQRLLGIYAEQDMRRLADQAVIPRAEIERRLEAAEFRVFPPLPLQDRLELYRCERR